MPESEEKGICFELKMNILLFGDYGKKDKLILPSLRKYVTSNETNQENRRKSRKVKSEVKEFLYLYISISQNL